MQHNEEAKTELDDDDFPTVFTLNSEQFEAFMEILDQPLSENKGFQDLMSDKYRW